MLGIIFIFVPYFFIIVCSQSCFHFSATVPSVTTHTCCSLINMPIISPVFICPVNVHCSIIDRIILITINVGHLAHLTPVMSLSVAIICYTYVYLDKKDPNAETRIHAQTHTHKWGRTLPRVSSRHPVVSWGRISPRMSSNIQ